MSMTGKRVSCILSVLSLVLLLGACRGLGPEPTAERLKTRVESYINARKTGNLAALRACYLEADRDRVQMGNIIYLGAEIANLKVEGEEAEVELRSDFKVMGFTFKKVSQKSHWVWRDGDWYILPGNRKGPFSEPRKPAGMKLQNTSQPKK